MRRRASPSALLRPRTDQMLTCVWTRVAMLHRTKTHHVHFLCWVRSLGSNDIGVDGAKAVAAVLPKCASVQTLGCVGVPRHPPCSVPVPTRC